MSRPQIDPVKFKNLYSQMQVEIASLADKEGLLVFGKTGAGKSTTINYLLNRVIKKAASSTILSPKYDVAAEESEKSSPKIGHAKESQTLFPSAYAITDDLSFIDTAGLGDTRGLEISLLVALAIKQISAMASRTKGVMMVLPVTHFTKDRGIQLVEAFELLSQMMPVFKPEHFVFSITGLQEGLSSEQLESIKTDLLRELAELKAVIAERFSGSTDVVKKAQLDRISAALATCVTPENLFLISDLEDRVKQTATIERFNAYVATMPGLQESLSLPLTRELALELVNWSKGIALPAITLLSDRKAAHEALADVTKTQKEITRLHDQLKAALDRLPTVESLEVLENETRQLRERHAELIRQQNDVMPYRPEFPKIPLPSAGAGIGSFIKRRVEIENLPFDAFTVQEELGTRVLSTSQRERKLIAEVTYTVTGREAASHYSGGVTLEVKKGSFLDFQEELKAAKKELKAIEAAAVQLDEERKTHGATIAALQREIQGKAASLGLTLRAEDTSLQLLSQLLAERCDALNLQLVALRQSKTDIDAVFDGQKESYQFLFEVTQHADLDKKDSEVAKFMSMYADAIGKRYTLPQRSPTHARGSVFGGASVGHHVDPGAANTADGMATRQHTATM